MAKYTSGRQRDLKIGISSYSEDLTSLEVIGKVGIGTTSAGTVSLYVVGDTYITGILTANKIFSNVYGEFVGSISGTNIVGTSLSISGISTLGITSATNLTAQTLNVSGVSTLPTLSGTTATYSTGNFSNGYINTGIITTLSGTTATYGTGNFSNGYINTGIVTTLSGTNLSYVGIATIGTLGVSGVTTTQHLSVIGVSTLGITSATNLTAQTLNVSGIVTGYSFRPSSGYYQSPNGTNSFYVYDGTGNVAFQGTIGASQINSASGYKAFDFTSTTTPFVNITNGLNVGTGGTILITTSSGLVGIGSTNPTSKLDIIGDVKVSGVVTATTFNGQVNSGVGTITTLSGTTATYNTGNFTTGNIVTGVVTTLTSTNATLTNINSSGISTLGVTSSTDFTAQQLSISGLSTHIGISTFKSSLFGTEASFTGVVTASSFSGNASSATYASTAGIATYATSSGIATALQYSRTISLSGDVVGSVSFDGTSNVSIASTIQPNSVSLGNDTTGDYVENITGTSNQITVTGGTGEGSTPTLSIPSQFTIPQDSTVTRDLQVNRNLNVTGNITIGGTTAFINVQQLQVSDSDLVLGFRTDGSNNDVSNDTTANHGGIAVASTEGNPLVSLYNPGIGESTPSTYKKIMWFKSGSFSGLNTDAWLINYAVGIGSTQFPSGTRLAVGDVQFTQNDLTVVRNINALGIVTATTFVGALTGTATSTTNIPNLSGDITSNNTTTTLATVNSNVGTYGDVGAIPSITVNAKGLVTGVTTVAPNNGTLTLGVSGTGLSGSATFTANQSGSSTFTVTSNATDANTASSIVARDSSGNFSAGTITANLTGTASSATYATSAGVSTSVISGIASVSQLNVTGISTVGFLTATNIFNSGVTTSSSFVKINGTSSQFLKADGSVDSNTYLTAETDTLNSITGRGNVTSNGISVGVLTATSGNFSGIVTSSGANISGVTTSSGFNATVGNDYKINNTSVLTSTTLGSGVVNSSLTSVGTLGSLTVTNVASASTFIGNLTGTATTANNISSGSTGNIFYQSSSGITTFLTNGTAGFILQSNGLGNAPSWVAAAPSSAISGLTIQDNTTQKGVANSITTLNFSGLNVSATASGGISTISISNNLVGTALSISGITTLSSTTLIGDGTSTGTSGQILQITGISSGAYIGGSVGIGSTNPTSKLYVVGDTYITGILTANRIISNVYGEFTGGSISGTNIVGTALSISGISTVGFLTATNIFNSGVTTSSSFVKINGTSSQFLKADGSVDSSTYLTTTGSGTNLTGIVTSIIAGTNISVSGSTGQVTINSTSGSLDILEVMLFA